MGLARTKSGSAGSTIIKKIADETVSALRLVSATSLTNVELADKDNYNDSKVLGVSITGALVTEDVRIVTFGEIQDTFFTFALNEPLFLGDNGVITSVAPLTGLTTIIGHGLGNGSIFVNIREPIENC